MSRRIQPLSAQLASQIAAGEVVERPASVAKELLENSIDAGADQISLELEQGGLKLLRVSDNGGGIHPEDLPLALAQHATSKIYSQAELEQIASLGFRGEALASIASVSRFTLCSYYPGEAHAWQIGNQGRGGPGQAQACALEAGTRIEVRDLFYNTPARRKFLRTERTEFLHVEEVIRRLALSRYDIAFSFSHNGRSILRLRRALDETQRQGRIGEILGKGFMRHALKVDVTAAGMRLSGFLAPPEHSLSQTGSQYFYLNGRMIRDKLVAHAIRQAHLTALEAGRHPAYVLYLEIDPAQVDINVHPTKHEVRFRQTRLVHDFLQRALSEALNPQEPPAAAPSSGAAPGPSFSEAIAEQQSSYRQSSVPRALARTQTPLDTRGMLLLYGRYLLRQREAVQVLDMWSLRRQRWLSQLRHALADGEMVSTPVLVPEILSLSAAQLAQLQQHAQQWLRLGLLFDALGPDSLVLRELPRMMQGLAQGQLLELLLAESPRPEDEDWQSRLIDGLLARMPGLSLEQAASELQQAQQLGEPLPWRLLDEDRLRQWLTP